jgi:hypothetical protein
MESSTLVSGTSSSSGGDLVVEATRCRQVAPPVSPFRDVLAGGVGLLVRGAAVATSVVAGPTMAAAVRGVGTNASTALTAPPMRAPTPGSAGAAAVGALGTPATGLPAVGTANVPTASLLSPGNDQSDLATMQAMQRESQVFNTQLLELQEDVQQENRRFTTVSNVLRAKHDTAKAAVSNIRA